VELSKAAQKGRSETFPKQCIKTENR